MAIKRLRNFEIWDFYSVLDKKLKFIDADDTPFVMWHNGVPCYEANMYMLQQLQTHKSRRVKGGTLSTYAHNIIHLVKFCYENKIQFSQLNDNLFILFVQGLQGERNKIGELIRKNNTVRGVVIRCLEFLLFVQECNDTKNLIGFGKENAIQIISKTHKIKLENKAGFKEINTLSHRSMPTPDAVHKRLPVSEDAALKIWEYIQKQDNEEVSIRDSVIYQCLEQLGGRITELHFITTQDIKAALKSGKNPSLKLVTLKQRDQEKVRYIPVTAALLSSINHYITFVRKPIIKRTIGKENDHDYLFVSVTTGKALDSKTTSTYMNRWKRVCGIEGDIHPHLFRHAFITNKLKQLILEHNEINSADDFRKHLLNTEYFKLQLREWTGHTHLHSLEIYINLVFADLSGYNQSCNNIQLRDSVLVTRQAIQQIKSKVANRKVTPTKALILIEDLLDAFDCDIERSLEGEIVRAL